MKCLFQWCTNILSIIYVVVLYCQTRILATNNINILPQTDKILVLKNGEILAMGTFDELMNTNGTFADLIKEHHRTNSDEDNKQTTGKLGYIDRKH